MFLKNLFPVHVGFVPDGNRRWARKNGCMPWEGHRMGAVVCEKIAQDVFDGDSLPLLLGTFSRQSDGTRAGGGPTTESNNCGRSRPDVQIFLGKGIRSAYSNSGRMAPCFC